MSENSKPIAVDAIAVSPARPASDGRSATRLG